MTHPTDTPEPTRSAAVTDAELWYYAAPDDVYMTKSRWLGGGGGYGPGFYPDPPQHFGYRHWSEAKYHAPGLVGNGHWEHVETYVVEPRDGAVEAFVEVLRRKPDGAIKKLETYVWKYSRCTATQAALARVEAEHEALIETLRWYADTGNYDALGRPGQGFQSKPDDVNGPAEWDFETDDGYRAAVALQAVGIEVPECP